MAWLAGGVFAPACDTQEECNAHDESGCDTTATATTGTGAMGGGGSARSLAQTYCDCMLVSCHDAYHATYGPDTDEPAARDACLATAGAWPEAGTRVEMGDFVECRIHFCELGMNDPSVCQNAVGAGACE